MTHLSELMYIFGGVVLFFLLFLSFTAPKVEKEHKQAQETARRQTKCTFSGKVSRSAFQSAAEKACQNMKELTKYQIRGTVIHGFSVRKKDNTSWAFDLDFNDNGSITGRYWIYSENPHSKLPEQIGSLIQETLEADCKMENVVFECRPAGKPIADAPEAAASSVIPVLAAIAFAALILCLSQLL